VDWCESNNIQTKPKQSLIGLLLRLCHLSPSWVWGLHERWISLPSLSPLFPENLPDRRLGRESPSDDSCARMTCLQVSMFSFSFLFFYFLSFLFFPSVRCFFSFLFSNFFSFSSFLISYTLVSLFCFIFFFLFLSFFFFFMFHFYFFLCFLYFLLFFYFVYFMFFLFFFFWFLCTIIFSFYVFIIIILIYIATLFYFNVHLVCIEYYIYILQKHYVYVSAHSDSSSHPPSLPLPLSLMGVGTTWERDLRMVLTRSKSPCGSYSHISLSILYEDQS